MRPMHKILFVVLLFLILYFLLNIIGNNIWRRNTSKVIAQLENNLQKKTSQFFDLNNIADLPEPVKKYLSKAIPDGQRVIRSVELEQKGMFNLGNEQDNWFIFQASQRSTINKNGFLWNAKINYLPGISFFIHDSFVDDEGSLKVKLMGLFPILDKPSNKVMDRSEFIRFLAESPWYPSFMLPDDNLTWVAVDDSTAIMKYMAEKIEAELIVSFDDNYLIKSIRCEDRGRLVGSEVIPTVWVGQWRNYQNQKGFLIPMEGEVAWIIGDRTLTYWKGEVTKIKYRY